ncbi:hypothetical protein HNQ92_003912 [Rhabdobacter roseus]|uniref:Uncharacterized protein n=1 Tax=Rhabdobacter roseus TaxID=1655419 RepID=A0A840TVZ4_9BACT|nr:hypothetical protein [Rhabdobacter roseus]MBB5285752.1 hypothetical protein [Rhabdobacter roseus]
MRYLPTIAQTVNGIPIKELEAEYLQIEGTHVLLSPKLSIDIDYGQRDRALVLKDTEVRDENNKPVKFNSMIDALNFMSAQGYEFVQAYTMQDSSHQTSCYFLLKRKKSEKEK